MRNIFILLIMISGFWLHAEPAAEKHSISGYVKDGENGEALIGATVFIKELKSGTVTNSYGFYSLSLPPGTYTLKYSYLGYETLERKIQLSQNVTVNTELLPAAQTLDEVKITAERSNKNIVSAEMSVEKLEMKQIKSIPALMGEVDIIKAIQLLPGVQSTSEGSSGFSVRGGSRDQNLIVLDEATVYNASHFAGFFSVFNNDAIKDVKLYKGDIPLQYGGRLSSLLDVRMKDGNAKKIEATGGIGTISSRLTVEGPIVKDKATFLASGRRTYADLMLLFASDTNIRQTKFYFYDLNGKLSWILGENDRLFLSAYNGKDLFGSDFSTFGFGNSTTTLRWNHLMSKKLFLNTSIIYSRYNYLMETEPGQFFSFKWTSNMEDYTVKQDYTFFLNPLNTIKFGAAFIRHNLNPGMIKGVGDESSIRELKLLPHYSNEWAMYLSNEQKIGTRLILKYGIRGTLFQNVGLDTVYTYDENYNVLDSTGYGWGEVFHHNFNPEPRFGVNYIINERNSVKASYMRTVQYMHLASNSTAGSPLDIYFSTGPNVKPQLADQYALGYFRNFKNDMFETSVEVFYKDMKNSIDFRDFAELLGNPYLDGELRFGSSYAYGAEFLVRKNIGKVTGWISYTYSRVWRDIPGVNNGKKYPASYDKPHDVSIVLSYEIAKRVVLGMNWVYASGSAVTYPAGRIEYGGLIFPIYSERNEYRLPDYHRMDFSVTLKPRDLPDRFWHGELNLSIYNLYNRHNAWQINFLQDENNPERTYAEKVYLFPILPTLTYNFYF